jgi:hypothetical protein
VTELEPLTETVTVLLDEELQNALVAEGALLGDSQLTETIVRRLTQGVDLARIVGPAELLWRPVHAQAIAIDVVIDRSVAERLRVLADQCGYGLAVVVGTILYNDACRPWEARAIRSRAPFSPLRYEPGRGNIYSMRFDLPGYQIVFLKMLAGHAVGRDAVVGEALLALARQVHLTETFAGAPVTADALAFAHKMVRNADRQARA